MKLVIDSNRFFASLIKDSSSRKILLSPYFEFYTPHFFLDEFMKYKSEIIQKAKLPEETIKNIYNILIQKINFVAIKPSQPEFLEAMKIMEKIDIKDVPFITIALIIDAEGVWSEDKHFLRQNKIKTYTNKELLEILNKEIERINQP